MLVGQVLSLWRLLRLGHSNQTEKWLGIVHDAPTRGSLFQIHLLHDRGRLTKLEDLGLYSSSLTGTIPSEM
jgi:hypothetical protein